MKKFGILLIAVMLFKASSSFAQGYDPLQTMYTYQLQNINPAYTGTGDYKWRMGTLYRESGYIVSRPYRTTNASFDVNLPMRIWSGNIWGFGLSFVNDDQGDYRLVNRRVNLNIGVGQFLDPREEHSLSVGFQGGFGQRSIDYTDAYWDRQWVGEGFNRDIASGEPLIADVKGYFDLSTGIRYNYQGSGLMDFNGGISTYHFNTPDNSFYRDTNENALRQRFNVHAEFVHRIKDNSKRALKPCFVYSQQHYRSNLLIGSQLQFIFSYGTRTTGKRSESSFSMGLFGRYANGFNKNKTYDVLGTIAFDLAGFTFGAGYDVPLGAFRVLNGYQGAFEFMIGYKAGYRKGLYNSYSSKRKGRH